jgi:acyl carrier protein
MELSSGQPTSGKEEMADDNGDRRRQFEEEARQQIAAKSKTDLGRVELTSRLTDDLGLDSIDIAELGEEWGERHDIDFDVDDVLNVMTVWDVVETVTTKMDTPAVPGRES